MSNQLRAQRLLMEAVLSGHDYLRFHHYAHAACRIAACDGLIPSSSSSAAAVPTTNITTTDGNEHHIATATPTTAVEGGATATAHRSSSSSSGAAHQIRRSQPLPSRTTTSNPAGLGPHTMNVLRDLEGFALDDDDGSGGHNPSSSSSPFLQKLATQLLSFDEVETVCNTLTNVARGFDKGLVLLPYGPHRRGHPFSTSVRMLCSHREAQHAEHTSAYTFPTKLLRALEREGYLATNPHRRGDEITFRMWKTPNKVDWNAVAAEVDDGVVVPDLLQRIKTKIPSPIEIEDDSIATSTSPPADAPSPSASQTQQQLLHNMENDDVTSSSQATSHTTLTPTATTATPELQQQPSSPSRGVGDTVRVTLLWTTYDRLYGRQLLLTGTTASNRAFHLHCRPDYALRANGAVFHYPTPITEEKKGGLEADHCDTAAATSKKLHPSRSPHDPPPLWWTPSAATKDVQESSPSLSAPTFAARHQQQMSLQQQQSEPRHGNLTQADDDVAGQKKEEVDAPPATPAPSFYPSPSSSTTTTTSPRVGAGSAEVKRVPIDSEKNLYELLGVRFFHPLYRR